MKFAIEPMNVGARIVNFPEGGENDPEVKADLYKAWLQYGVLIFKDIDSVEKHLAVSRCFGDLEIHPFPPARSEVHPLLINIGGETRTHAYVYDGDELRCNRIAWHRDTAYTPDLCKGAMLRMIEVPEQYGETMVCDTAQAYDALPADVKEKIATLEYKATLRLTPMQQMRPGAFWKQVRPATREEDPQWGKETDVSIISKYPPVILPTLLVHPESGRKCIFLSPTYIDFFIGMSPKESTEFHEYITNHTLQPQFIYKHKWTVNEALVWDNRRMMHASPGNLPSQKRKALRTTLAGAVRMGRYYDAGAEQKAPLLVD